MLLEHGKVNFVQSIWTEKLEMCQEFHPVCAGGGGGGGGGAGGGGPRDFANINCSTFPFLLKRSNNIILIIPLLSVILCQVA